MDLLNQLERYKFLAAPGDEYVKLADVQKLEDLKRDAARYRAIRQLNWSLDRLCVMETKDIPLGIQTYTEKMLDDEIDAIIEERKR